MFSAVFFFFGAYIDFPRTTTQASWEGKKIFAQWLYLGYRCVVFRGDSTGLDPVRNQMQRGEKMCFATILNLTLVLPPTRIYISVSVSVAIMVLAIVAILFKILVCNCAFSFSRHCVNLQRVVGRRHSVAVSLSTISLFPFSCCLKKCACQ